MSTKPVVYAFIDSQNLNLGIRAAGWMLDFKKFRLYLKNKYGVEKAYLFIGQMPGNESLYDSLQDAGYHLIFKPTTAYRVDGKQVVKGNVDAELVLYAAAKVYTKYNQAIIVSGDGDFTCLVEYLQERNKLLHLIVPNKNYSQLLGRYLSFIVRLDRLQSSLEYKKDQRQRSVETLGVSGHGDKPSITKKKNPRKDATLKENFPIGDDSIVAKTPALVNKSKQKSRDQRSVETLGLPGHGDKMTLPRESRRVKGDKR